MSFEPEEILITRKLALHAEIAVAVGDVVTPDTVIAEFIHPMPRMFFISVFRSLPNQSMEGYAAEWHVTRGEEVVTDTLVITFRRTSVEETKRNPRLTYLPEVKYRIPVSGYIEEIIPESGNILLSEHVDMSRKEVTVDLYAATRLRGRPLARLLKCGFNDFVEKGQSLVRTMRGSSTLYSGVAQTGGGSSVISSKAPISGIISDINIKKGTITISRKFQKIEQNAGLHGVVTEVDKRSITISVYGRRATGICGIGGESHGILMPVCKTNDEEISPDDITDCHRGGILLGGAFVSIDALRVAAEVGVAGIISGGADHEDLCEFVGRDISIATTGSEEIPFPVILTGGFGVWPMQQDICEFLTSSAGHQVYINGKTHIRAGVIRPEIIVQEKRDTV